MSLIDDVIASIEVDKQAAERIAALVAAGRRQLDNHVLSAVKQTPEEHRMQCAALAQQFAEAKSTAVAAQAVRLEYARSEGLARDGESVKPESVPERLRTFATRGR